MQKPLAAASSVLFIMAIPIGHSHIVTEAPSSVRDMLSKNLVITDTRVIGRLA